MSGMPNEYRFEACQITILNSSSGKFEISSNVDFRYCPLPWIDWQTMHSRFSTDIMFAYMIAEPTNIRQRLEAFGTTVSMVFSLTWMLARNGNRSVSRPRGDDQYVVWEFIAIFFPPNIKTAGLAQSVERQALNLMVEGSSPSFEIGRASCRERVSRSV